MRRSADGRGRRYIWETAAVSDDDDDDDNGGAADAAEPKMTSEERKKERNRRRQQQKRAAEGQREKEKEARLAVMGPSEGDLERTQLTRDLARGGFRIVPIAADGHCLFGAVALQTTGRADAAAVASLRAVCADALERNRETYAPFVGTADEFSGHCRGIREGREWGGHLEMCAIAAHLHRPVHVYMAGRAAPSVVGDTEAGEPLRLAFLRKALVSGEHYDAVVAAAVRPDT